MSEDRLGMKGVSREPRTGAKAKEKKGQGENEGNDNVGRWGDQERLASFLVLFVFSSTLFVQF